MIGLQNPFGAQIQDAERSREEIVRDYGEAAWSALIEGLELQRGAYRMGARLQLEACCSDLRNWAVAYRAKAQAIASGTEQSNDRHADEDRWEQVATEILLFARDWLSESNRPDRDQHDPRG